MIVKTFNLQLVGLKIINYYSTYQISNEYFSKLNLSHNMNVGLNKEFKIQPHRNKQNFLFRHRKPEFVSPSEEKLFTS